MVLRIKYVRILAVLLVLQLVFAPIHVIADDAERLHVQMVHQPEAPVVESREVATHTHHHHHDDIGHHHDTEAGDGVEGAESDNYENHHHHHDHEHVATNCDFVTTRTYVAKLVVCTIPNASCTLSIEQESTVISTIDERISTPPSSLTPPRRGPPSVQDFTSIS